jgi:hypothetical protein
MDGELDIGGEGSEQESGREKFPGWEYKGIETSTWSQLISELTPGSSL